MTSVARHRRRKRSGSALFFLFAAAWGFLSPPTLSAGNPPIIFEHYVVRDGLSQSSVTSIMQDRDGFLWFGTLDGLNRFDGYGFTIFRNNPLDPSSLSDNRTTCIFEDRRRNLWVGTYSGLNLLPRGERRFQSWFSRPGNEHTLSADRITAIREDRDGSLWIGTVNGLNHFDPATGNVQRYRSDPRDASSMAGNNVTSILIDDEGALWVTTDDGGLDLLDRSSGRFRHFSITRRVLSLDARRSFSGIFQDSKHRLWITGRTGLISFDRRAGTLEPILYAPPDSNASENNATRGIAEDPDGRLWVGTTADGALCFDPERRRFTSYRNDPANRFSLSDDILYCVFVDRAGSLWFGGEGGVSWIDRQHMKFPRFKLNPSSLISDPLDYILSIAPLSSGDIWIGSRGGLCIYDREMNVKRLYSAARRNAPGLEDYTVRAILEEDDGTVWIGTDQRGVYRYDPAARRFVNYRAEPASRRPQTSDCIFSLSKGNDGTLLVCTSDGLFTVERRTRRLRRLFDSERVSRVVNRGMLEDALQDGEGNYWFGFSYRGLFRYDPRSDSLRSYLHRSGDRRSLSDNSVWSLFRDSRGTLWVCTINGLSRFDRTRDCFTTFTEQDGLPNNTVYGMREDAEGDLWVSTNAGLSRYDPRTNRFRNFDFADGLQDNEFNQNAFARGRDGRLFFGGVEGFNAFSPREIRDNPFVPPVVITRFRIFDKDQPGERWDRGNPVELSWRENVVSFDFVSLNYADPQKNRYAYKLEGFDADWIECGTRRYAGYSNLPGGTYTFRVRGSNNDGIWNERGASIVIRVIPPPWRTWWAYGLYALLLALIVAAIVKFRERRLRAIEQLRLRIAADLHDDIGSVLTKITMQTELLKQDPEAAGIHPALDNIAASSRSVVSSMSDIVWAIDSRNDAVGNLLDRMREFASTTLPDERYCVRFRLEGIDQLATLPPETRQNIYLVFKEALNNVAKHSNADSVDIALVNGREGFLMEIRDNGKGRADCGRKTGHGLRNMRMRAARIGAELDIASTDGYVVRLHLRRFA